jgi:hypothetical protein
MTGVGTQTPARSGSAGRKHRKPNRMDRINRRKAELLDNHDILFLLDNFDPLREGKKWIREVWLLLFILSILLTFLA